MIPSSSPRPRTVVVACRCTDRQPVQLAPLLEREKAWALSWRKRAVHSTPPRLLQERCGRRNSGARWRLFAAGGSCSPTASEFLSAANDFSRGQA